MKLKQLQTQFSESLLYQHDTFTTQIKEGQSISAQQRLQVYRNSFVMGVTEALSITYQHTLALVGEEFFNTVARQFILNHPPFENNIMTYGDGFNQHLDNLAQLATMPYIAEMARFEWLLEQSSNTKIENKNLDLTKLSTIDESQLEAVQFFVPTQVTLFKSKQNIALLYQMIINNAVVETDLNTPCYLALTKQADFRIELTALEEDEYTLLQQIQDGYALGELVPASLHQELPQLLQKSLLNEFTIKEL